MALNPELVGFVREALDRGLPRERIEDILIRAGWPADQVRRALAGFADVESPIPVPRPAVSTRPREAFLYVVMFLALFVSAFNLGAVLFRLIDLALPDPAGMPPEVIRELLRFSVSALVVASPVFAFVTRVIRRGVEAQPSARGSRIRVQLTYLTLFVASCVLVGAVTALVYSFLGGQLTARFVLKSLTVTAGRRRGGSATTSAICARRSGPRGSAGVRPPRPPSGPRRRAVAVSVVAGLVALGSPAGQRLGAAGRTACAGPRRHLAGHRPLRGDARAAARVARRAAARLRRAGHHHRSGDARAVRLRGRGRNRLRAVRHLRAGHHGARAPSRGAVLAARGGAPLLPAARRAGPRPMTPELGRGVTRTAGTMPSSRPRWGRLLLPVQLVPGGANVPRAPDGLSCARQGRVVLLVFLCCLASVAVGSAQPARTQGWVLGLGSGAAAVSFGSDPGDGAALVGFRLGYGPKPDRHSVPGRGVRGHQKPRARGLREGDFQPRRPRREAAPGRRTPAVGPLCGSRAHLWRVGDVVEHGEETAAHFTSAPTLSAGGGAAIHLSPSRGPST